MLPLPPLAGLYETVKFLLPNIAEVTDTEEVLIRLGNEKNIIGYKSGKFFNLDTSPSKSGMVVIPLKAGDWLALCSTKGQIDHHALCQYCSQAVENARAYEAIQQQSLIDTLTGLPNRSAIYRKINAEINRLCMFCVLFIDLNGFKKINDTFGHLMGDDILKQTGSKIRSCLRKSDFLGRYGGDEFVVVLCETTSDKGVRIAERIKNEAFKAEGISVKLSVGMAMYPNDEKTPESLIKKADRRMYEDKKSRGGL